jgi:preprotein translocase subunit SecG
MLYFVSTIHVLLCVFMIFVILLQPGKDAGMGAAFGGGAATSAFGGRGAVTFLGKVTAVCAIAFFVTSLGLSFVGLRKSVASGSVVGATPPKPAEKAKDDKGAAPTGAAPAAPTGAAGAAPTGAAPAAPAGAAAPSGVAPGAVSDTDGTKAAAPPALPSKDIGAVPAEKVPDKK